MNFQQKRQNKNLQKTPFLQTSENDWQNNMVKNELRHDISTIVVCAISKGSDQPAHMRSLIRAFASRLNITWLLSYWTNFILSF